MSRTMREANAERKNISYTMSVEDEEKQRHIHLMEEKKEKEIELEGLKNLINVLLVHMMLYIKGCLGGNLIKMISSSIC